MERPPRSQRCQSPLHRLQTYKVRCDSTANPCRDAPVHSPSNDEQYLRPDPGRRRTVRLLLQAPSGVALHARAPKVQRLIYLSTSCCRVMAVQRTSFARTLEDSTIVIRRNLDHLAEFQPARLN